MRPLQSFAELLRYVLRVKIPAISAPFLWLLPRGRRLPNVVVSLTSYGKRLETTHAAIFSILRGKYIPEEIVLVVNEDLTPDVIRSLKPFKKLGLRILRSENLGPHKKYFPVIQEGLKNDVRLVTADDDIFYKRNWLQKLFEAHQTYPNDVICWWANVITFTGDNVNPYHDWPVAATLDGRVNHFPVGAGGVLYPPSMITALRQRGDAFLVTAPKTDDIWLHSTAVETGHLVRQVVEKFEWPRHIPGTQTSALKHLNHLPGGNDLAVRLTYSKRAMALLLAAAS